MKNCWRNYGMSQKRYCFIWWWCLSNTIQWHIYLWYFIAWNFPHVCAFKNHRRISNIRFVCVSFFNFVWHKHEIILSKWKINCRRRERERVTRKKEMKKGQKSKISSLCILGVDVMERKEECYVYFVRHFFPESLLIARKATNTTGYVRNITCSFLWWVKRHFTTFYFIFSVCVSLSFRFVSHFCAGFLVSDSSVKVDGCIGK